MITYIENWAYKFKIQYINPLLRKPQKTLSCFFAILGGIYSFVEAETLIFGSEHLLNIFKSNLAPILTVISVVSLFLNREKAEYSEHLGNKDYSITLKMADLLKVKNSAIVIPTNTTFDTLTKDEFISDKSVQGKFQKKYFKHNISKLDQLLQKSLDQQYPDDYIQLNDRVHSKCRRYKIGTVAKVTIKNTHYYFLAVADVTKTGKTINVTMATLTQALIGLWDYLSKEGHTEPLTIPVIGTGRAGLTDGNLEDVIKETIFSFILSAQEAFVAKGLNICIYAPTLKKSTASWDNLCNYLKLQCTFATENAKQRKRLEKTGTPISWSSPQNTFIR